VELTEGRLFVGLARARGGWLCHSDKNGIKMVAVLGNCFGEFVERAKDRMGSIGGEVVPIA
jgi:hypothetical protein